MSKKNLFLAKHGSAEQVDAILKNTEGWDTKRDTYNTVRATAMNPNLTRKQHEKLLGLGSTHIDKDLVGCQPHMDSDLVNHIAHKHGTFVASEVVSHPNTTSHAVQHVLNDLDGGPDNEDYAESKNVNSWKAKRDWLKSQGR